MVKKMDIEAVKEKMTVDLWNYCNAAMNEKYRLAQTWGKRSEIVDFYCQGRGIEIGASAYPVKINNKRISISYVDCIDRNITKDIKASNRLQYKHVDVIDDIGELTHFKGNSLDFIIHCHVLEHCKNPIGVIRKQMSKIKRNGVLVVAIPNKNYIFDRERPLTTWEHLEADDVDSGGGYSENDKNHFKEYLRLSCKFEGDVESEMERLIMDDYRPHFHVWDLDSFYDFLLRMNQKLNNAFLIEHYSENRQHKRTRHESREIIAVLRKR